MQVAIPLALGGFLLWYIYNLFTPEQLEQTYTHFKEADYWIVAFSVGLSVLSHLMRAYRWNLMLEPMGYHPKLANNFMAVSVAYLMNLFIPKSGEVSRAVIHSKYEGIPFDKGFGTIISERVVDLFFLGLFTLTALLMQFDALYDYINATIPIKKMIIALVALAILTTVFLVFVKRSKGAFAKKIKVFLGGLQEGLFSIVKMKKKGLFILLSFVIWALYVASFYVATKALDETSNFSAGIIIITFVVGSFTFAFTNSGFGTYPAAIMGILLIFGIAKSAGLAFGVIVWTSNIISIVFFGLLSLFLLPVYNRKKEVN
ncbi:flippase-like domain-containing protein [Aureitalea sp. L0-47]|nr:flippase-like domain-containing protein [Aureitalea sp. L0-47]